MSQTARSNADARADEILDRITGTFARRGLEGASMQDLAAAAGMSVGNFYRYYPSKVALITALVERCARDVRESFDAARMEADPMKAMQDMLLQELHAFSEEETALWLQIDAAAVMQPEIAAVKRAMDETIRADVRSMLGSLPQAAAVGEARVEDLTDFMLLFASSLFRQQAFEHGPQFSAKAERMTAHLFDMVRMFLGASAEAAAAVKG